MTRWTAEEEIVLVYYASRQIKHATIVAILDLKCRPEVRTLRQIAHKATRLRTQCVQEENTLEGQLPTRHRGWDRKLADRWIFSKMEKVKMDKVKMEKLLNFDGETAAIIDEVSGSGDPWQFLYADYWIIEQRSQ